MLFRSNYSRSPQIIFEEKMKKLQNDPKAIDGLGFSASIRSGKETDMIIYQIKPIYNFLKLLINKNDTCILSTDLETYNTKITISNYNNCIFEFEYYHIDHDKDSILNNIDNYCKTTNLLVNELKDDNSREYRKRSIQENFTYIDIDKCIDLIQNTSDSYNESDFEIE